MSKRDRTDLRIQLEYSFDRLSLHKLTQVYQQLVLTKMWAKGAVEKPSINKINQEVVNDVNSCDLCSSVLGATKRS